MSKSQQWSDIDINWISGTCLLAGLALGKGEGTALIYAAWGVQTGCDIVNEQ